MPRALFQGLGQLRRSFQDKESSPGSVLEETLQQIALRNPHINCMSEINEHDARQAAEDSDARWRKGQPISELDGVPITIKDSIHVAGMGWRHGVAANRNFPKSQTDSPPTSRLREAGAVIIGKTTMPDFGMLAAGVSSLYGITRNPWDVNRNPGGSSSGAAAGLACGIGFGAVGTDIAGSVRIPAALCGLVGIKPTQGRIPHLPVSTMRSAGPLARNMDDLQSMFNVLARPDIRDIWSLAPVKANAHIPRQDLASLRIGVIKDMGYGSPAEKQILDCVDAASDALRDGGASVEELSAAFDMDPYPPLDRLFQVRALAELLSIPLERRQQVETYVAEWAMRAQGLSAVDYQRDVMSVAESAAGLNAKLSRFDAIVTPVFPAIGFPAESVGLDFERPLADCGFTCWFNQTGQPAASICFGTYEGLPIGVQVVAARFSDWLVMRICSWLEIARPFDLVWPDEGPSEEEGSSRD